MIRTSLNVGSATRAVCIIVARLSVGVVKKVATVCKQKKKNLTIRRKRWLTRRVRYYCYYFRTPTNDATIDATCIDIFRRFRFFFPPSGSLQTRARSRHTIRNVRRISATCLWTSANDNTICPPAVRGGNNNRLLFTFACVYTIGTDPPDTREPSSSSTLPAGEKDKRDEKEVFRFYDFGRGEKKRINDKKP